jgi:glycosyltransferase involved in cell wall biosynthesis
MDNYVENIYRLDLTELSKMLILDANLILSSDLLKKMDIATMSNSLEGRSPFLSKYMLEWAPKISDKHKIKGTKTKNILRELALKYSLTEVYNQPKKGFEVPLKKWVEGEIKENIFDSLGSSSYSKSYVDSNFIENVLNGNQNISKEKRAKILWNLYALEIWHKNYSKYSLKNEIPSTVEKVVKKIHVLFLATGLGLGGAERVVLDICSNINHNYFKTNVIGVSTQEELLPEFRKKSIETSILGHKKSMKAFYYSLKEVNDYVRKNNVNIIHSHMFHTLLIATLIKLFKPSLQIVFTPHNTFISMPIRRWSLWFLKPFRDVDTLFSKDALRFFHKQNYKVIPNGIDLTKYSNSSQQNSTHTFTFVIVGRLEYMKNHNFLIDVIYQLNQLNKYDFQLKIVGSGILEDALKSKVETLELNNIIDFLGARDDVPALLKDCDCLLLPSLWEAFPIVLLEAAACNIPVITTSVGSISTLVDQNNGYIVELDKFKDAMIDVLENYDEAKSKSLNLQNKVKSNYQIKNIVKQYESIYQKILQ